MRIAELSRRTDVSTATIKYYTREGLLPAGERSAHNQTAYSDAHVARLRLVRALLGTGGLSVAAAKQVLAAIDDDDLPVGSMLGRVQSAIAQSPVPPSEASIAAVRAMLERHGWSNCGDTPGVATCAAVLDRLGELGRDDLAGMLDRYADSVLAIAEHDIAMTVADAPDRTRMAETVAVGSVLGDAAIAGLRQIAQAHVVRLHEERSEGDRA